MRERPHIGCLLTPVLALLFFFVPAKGARAQDVRPLVTESVAVLPLDAFQLQLGEDYISGFHSIRTGRKGNLWQDAHLNFRWGISDRVELDVDGLPYKRYRADSGRTDAGVGDFTVWGKFILWQGDNPGTAFGFRLGVKMPNTPSYKDFGTNQTDFYAQLLSGKSWGRFKIWWNLGLGILDNPRIRQSQDDIYQYGLAFSCAMNERWTLVGEGQGFISRGRETLYGDNHAVRLGVLYTPTRNWTFDVAVAKSSGLLYGSWSATAGVSYGFHL